MMTVFIIIRALGSKIPRMRGNSELTNYAIKNNLVSLTDVLDSSVTGIATAPDAVLDFASGVTGNGLHIRTIPI